MARGASGTGGSRRRSKAPPEPAAEDPEPEPVAASPKVGVKRKQNQRTPAGSASAAAVGGSGVKGRRPAKATRTAEIQDVATATAEAVHPPSSPLPIDNAQPPLIGSKAAAAGPPDGLHNRSGGLPADHPRKVQKARKDKAGLVVAAAASESVVSYDPSDLSKPLPNGLLCWGKHTLTNKWYEIKILERRVRRDYVYPDKKLNPRAPVFLEKKSKWQTKAEAALTTLDEDSQQQAILNLASGLISPTAVDFGSAVKREDGAAVDGSRALAAWAERVPPHGAQCHLISQHPWTSLQRQDSDAGSSSSSSSSSSSNDNRAGPGAADGSADQDGGEAQHGHNAEEADDNKRRDFSSHAWDYYVHYTRWDRRMDEWLPRNRIVLAGVMKQALALQQQQQQQQQHDEETAEASGSDEESSGRQNRSNSQRQSSSGAVRRGGHSGRMKPEDGEPGETPMDLVEDDAKATEGEALPDDSSEAALAAAIQVKQEEVVEGSAHGGHHGFSVDDMRAHEEATKLKNISFITLGRYTIATWYFSPFPEEYDRFDKLYFCEFCLQFFGFESELVRHEQLCQLRHPPGNEIYRSHDTNVTVAAFEIDGAKEQQYCENLCYIAKLFLDHKTLEYDCSPFLFYVICELDDRGYHLVGYFSKEKQSAAKFNLACILTLPCHQRKGYGRFLISLSYELSKLEQQVGSPEKPISDLGKLSYMSYWSQILIQELFQLACGKATPPKPFLVGEVADDPLRLRQFEEQAQKELDEACDMRLLQLPGRLPGQEVEDGVPPVPLRDVLRLSTGEPAISIDQLSRMTSFTTDDILETLEHLKLLVWYKGSWVFSVTRLVYLYDKMQRAEAARQRKLDNDPAAMNVMPCIPEKLHWTPYNIKPRNKRLLIL